MHLDDESKDSSRKVAASEPTGADHARVFPPLAGRAVVLTGPTASGKSSLALQVAERIGAEIISLDSIAVYQGMDIGTAKPSRADQDRVAHHLIDITSPDQSFSVACYLEAAHALLDEMDRRGRRAIFVGGTPMYLKGIMRGFDPGPPADWKFRQSVEDDLARHGPEALRDRLRQVDPLAAHRINENDTRRMIRALEVARHTGVPLSHRQIQFDQRHDASTCKAFVIRTPRDQLHRQINERVQRMFDDGLVDEVRSLLDQYGTLSRTASQAVGYREVIDHLQKSVSVDETKAAVAAHTRRLARRQETWFRSFSELTPIDFSGDHSVESAVEKIVAVCA